MGHYTSVVRLVIAVSLVKVALTASSPALYAKEVDAAQKFLSQLSESRVIGGTVAVQKAGQLIWSKGFGYASEELGVPLQADQIFPIGSNTKFFTAVAVYQLQEKGLLNVSDAVNGYIDPADFGLDGPWCPKVHGQEQLGCQEPTIKQLLSMSSGLLPSDNLGCGTPNSSWTPTDWFWPYRIFLKNVSYGDASGDTGNWLNGKATSADLLRLQQAMKEPMLHVPGAQYCYVNTNFNIAGYVIERLTNMSYASYVDEFILKPANLSNTYYWIGGQGLEQTGIRKNVVSIPGYTTIFGNDAGSGAPAFKVVNRVNWLPMDLSVFAGAAGAMFSDTFDLLKWYNTFTAQPEVVGLSKESLAALTAPLQPVNLPGELKNASFAQGVVAEPVSGSARNKKLLYTGGIWGFLTHIEYWLNSADPTKSDAVLFFSNVNPVIPSTANGDCTVRSAQDGNAISLEAMSCNPNGADMTSFVTERLAKIFNITGDYSSS